MPMRGSTVRSPTTRMGIFGNLFGKKSHDPAQALIDWLERHPKVCRRTVVQSCGAQHEYAGRVLTWIVMQPRCDSGTALNALWETLAFGAVREFAERRDDPSKPSPMLVLVETICRNWRTGRYQSGEFGFDNAEHRRRFMQELRKHRCKQPDFGLPEDVLAPLPGARFSQQLPANLEERSTLESLIQDMWICDRAIEDPEQWLPKRKQRLGY